MSRLAVQFTARSREQFLRQCEERSDDAIHDQGRRLNCFASPAMTERRIPASTRMSEMGSPFERRAADQILFTVEDGEIDDNGAASEQAHGGQLRGGQLRCFGDSVAKRDALRGGRRESRSPAARPRDPDRIGKIAADKRGIGLGSRSGTGAGGAAAAQRAFSACHAKVFGAANRGRHHHPLGRTS